MIIPCSILDDKRKIEAVWDGPSLWTVGYGGITKIVVYSEMASVPWAAIYYADKFKERVSLATGGVRYVVEKIK